MFNIIVATDIKNGIGKSNSLPWLLKDDLKYFKNLTTNTIEPNKQNAVIMGKNTWFSIPEKYRPLSNRLNIVLSSNYKTIKLLPENVIQCTALDSALDYIKGLPDVESSFVIGGGMVYKEACAHDECETIYQTKIFHNFECDTYFPEIDLNLFKLTNQDFKQEIETKYCFETYKRKK